METSKFNPNLENIEKRANIKPFGNISIYTKLTPTEIHFKLHSNSLEMKIQPEVKKQEKTKSDTYVPPSFSESELKSIHKEISIRISNIPISLSKDELTILLGKAYGKPMDYVNLLRDKETSKSRGIAYINIGTLEAAREFYNKTKCIVIENCKLAIEILQK